MLAVARRSAAWLADEGQAKQTDHDPGAADHEETRTPTEARDKDAGQNEGADGPGRRAELDHSDRPGPLFLALL